MSFNGRCREAMQFYQAFFGGELSFKTVAETPMADRCPESMHQHIMHALLKSPGLVLMATDMLDGKEAIRGNTMSLCLNCESEEEIRSFYAYLSKDGKINDELRVQFWGDLFGCVTDRYGVTWMLNFETLK